MSAYFRPDPGTVLSTKKTANRTLRIIFIPWEQGTPESREWKEKSEQWNIAKGADTFTIVYFDPAVQNVACVAANSDPTAAIYIRGHGSPGAISLKTTVGDEQRSMSMDEVCQRLIDSGLGPAFSGAIKFHSCYSATIFTNTEFATRQATAQGHLDRAIDMRAQAAAIATADIQQVTQSLAQSQADLATEKNKSWFRRDRKEVSRLKADVSRRSGRLQDLQAQDTSGADAYVRERELRVPQNTSLANQGATYMRAQGFTNCTYYGYLGPMESTYDMDTSPTSGNDAPHKFVSLEGLADRPTGIGTAARARASTVRMKIL